MSSVQDKETQDLVMRGLLDTGFFAKAFMPEAFNHPNTEYDRQAWQMINDEGIPKAAICGYRGFGKSTRLEAYAIKNICYRKALYILYVSSSLNVAEERTESMKAELMENKYIRTVFNLQQPKNIDGLQRSFSKKSWFVTDASTGKAVAYVVPKGAGQTTRGFNINIGGKRIRPDLIICDDVEDDEDVLNPETRVKLWKWFSGALINCVPPVHPDPKTDRWKLEPGEKPPWRIFYMDTLKHADANIRRVMNSAEWKSLYLPMAKYDDTTERFVSCVPELFDDAQVQREAELAMENDTFDSFCREKLCLPSNPKDQTFTEKMFRWYRDTGELNSNPVVARFIVVDPASTDNPKSCYSSFKAVCVDALNQKIYIRRHEMKRLYVDDLADEVLSMSLQYNSPLIYVEKTGMQDAIKSVFETAATKRKLAPHYEWLEGSETPKGEYGHGKQGIKRARAFMIHPFMNRGHVHFDESMKNGLLQRELLSFPDCVNWDGTDTLGYVPTIMHKLNIYFAPTKVEKEEERPNYHKMMKREIFNSRMKNREWAAFR